MMNEAEKRFHEAERQLDELLRRDEAMIAARGIAITDRSVRAYNYKSDCLVWDYTFEVRRARGSEVEKVWVWVTLYEHDAEVVRVWRSAEIFQIGKLSRWQSTSERLLALDKVVRDGLSSIVIEAIRAGEAAAAGAA
jgi:hypothetical protein